jgi:hypothetical protein
MQTEILSRRVTIINWEWIGYVEMTQIFVTHYETIEGPFGKIVIILWNIYHGNVQLAFYKCSC